MRKNPLLLTKARSSATSGVMKPAATLLLAATLAACGGCVQVQAPDKPIEINLNVNIKQEVILSLKKDASDLITSNPELFPK
jgi:YnbE-like lipoprotein